MYYDEEEPYYNPEEFLEEYEINLRNLIANAVNHKIQSTIEQLQSFQDENKKLKDKIRELKNNIYNINTIHKQQLDKALVEKELEVQRNLSCGFTPHDKVWYIKSEASHKKCEQCDGKGKVEIEVLGKMSKVNCPHCSSGNIISYKYFPIQDVVGAIYFDFHRADRNKKSGIVLNVKDVYLENCDYSKKPDGLYKTLEECQEICNKRNADPIEN